MSTPEDVSTTTDSHDDDHADPRALFKADVSPRGFADSIRQYIGRLRTGDPGGLPSLLGLLVLGVIFASTTKDFLSHNNVANLTGQASFFALIALGLVFVLLIGEIDLSAGTTGGMCAAFAAQGLASKNLHGAVGNIVFTILVIGMIGAIVIGVTNRMWTAPAFVLIGLILLLSGAANHHQALAFVFAVSVGVSVGMLSGVLVAQLGIPSFIVTLALFLAWEGVQLYALKNQSVGTTNFNYWFDLTHGTMAPWAGWLFFIILVGGYLAVTLTRSILRRRAGLSSDTVLLVLVRAGSIAVLGAFATYFLNQNRAFNSFHKIEGVPWAASVPIMFMVLWTIVLSKSTWGRHLYAIGGNVEAARRAGIPVERVKISAFAICSGMAAVGGLFLADFSGGATTGLGQGDILLSAVAAAVIGGTSLFGGRGKPRDALVGALVIATIPNGIHLHNFPEQANEIITGLVLLVAASVDAISRRRSKTS
ncbi:MAG TPA: ABC transporter permease [Jatrophihabitantaceae bacterium]|jgi:D-xylose transport system permease protein|nr:ABC transporter permease [Jatrophihabitantaceae bacterium]